jgi:lipopolysaccharide biosynthesis regulator YciM
MSLMFLLLVIALAVVVGCYVGQKHLIEIGQYQPSFSKDYFAGLNYLLNEEPDKAVDVFIRLLQVDSETVETHLALGSLFRKRGEIWRAIKIHQNLIARPQLPREHRVAALVALGTDYLNAGLVDRAEKLFLEITRAGDVPLMGLHYLLRIYQQQKNWTAAIKVAEQLGTMVDEPLYIAIAHFHCELARVHIKRQEIEAAERELKNALKKDEKCVRANLMLGKLFLDADAHKQAINTLKNIFSQDPIFFSEALSLLVAAYEKMNAEDICVEFLLTLPPNIDVTLFLTGYKRKTESDLKAIEYLTAFLQKFPSLKGLQYLIDLREQQNGTLILKEIIKNLLKSIPHYRCVQCGFKSNGLIWLCPGCQQWGEIKPVAH